MRLYDAKEKFVDSQYIHESKEILDLVELAIQNKCDHMFVSPSEARMLQSLLEIHRSRKVVEIGTLYGYSSYYLSKGVGANGKIWTLEKSQVSSEIAKKFHLQMNVSNVDIVVGDAHESLSSIEKHGPFDAIFIDADKAGYPDYLDWASKNIRVGGLIVADNTFLGGSVWIGLSEKYSSRQIQKMQAFHEAFSDSSKFSSTVFTSADGLAVGIKK